MYWLPPNNQAKSVSVSGGVGLPWNSRYMGTFQYTKMTSDATGLPFSGNPLVLAALPGFGTSYTTPDRETSTTLFNNVLNTQITSDLKSTLRYRYYNIQRREYAGQFDELPAEFGFDYGCSG